MSQAVGTRSLAGDRLSEGVLRKMWELRVSSYRPAEAGVLAQDWARFRSNVGRPECRCLLWFVNETVVGFFSVIVHRGTHEGRSYTSFEEAQLYLGREVRGRNDYATWGFSVLLREWCRAPRERMLLMAELFLPGYIACRSYHPQVLSLMDGDLSNWHRGLLDSYARRWFDDWDPVIRRVRFPLRPLFEPAQRARWLGSRYAADYLALCPDWTEGLITPFLVPLRPRNLLHAGRTMVMRRLRRHFEQPPPHQR
jgi:hypothetical protein